MSPHPTHTGPNTLPYRYANCDASDAEAVVRSTSRLPNPVFSNPPSQFPLRHIPSESGSFLGAPTTRFINPEEQEYTRMGDFTCRADCCNGQARVFPSASGWESHGLKCPLDRPHTPSQSSVTGPTSTNEPPSHGTPAHPVFFTDDARIKLGDHIRRQCTNCGTTTTKAWRRSVLSSGKMVCNKCGLFERSHAVPRPKSFPRKRHLQPMQPTPVYTNMDHPFDHAEYCHHDDRLSGQLLTTDSPSLNASGPPGGQTSSQGTMSANHRHGTMPPTTHLSPSHTVSPQPSSTPHYAGSHISPTVPVEAARLPSHLGVSPHQRRVAENRDFDAFSRAS